jgi:hypothetical protein
VKSRLSGSIANHRPKIFPHLRLPLVLSSCPPGSSTRTTRNTQKIANNSR